MPMPMGWSAARVPANQCRNAVTVRGALKRDWTTENVPGRSPRKPAARHGQAENSAERASAPRGRSAPCPCHLIEDQGVGVPRG